MMAKELFNEAIFRLTNSLMSQEKEKQSFRGLCFVKIQTKGVKPKVFQDFLVVP